jgi:hypothetical protein
MAISEMNRVWEHSTQKGSNLLLLLAIADNANSWGYAFPGIAYLAKKTRMSERQVRRNLEEIAADGELYIDRTARQHGYLVLTGLPNEEIQTRRAQLARHRRTFAPSIPDISDTDNDAIVDIRTADASTEPSVKRITVIKNQQTPPPKPPSRGAGSRPVTLGSDPPDPEHRLPFTVDPPPPSPYDRSWKRSPRRPRQPRAPRLRRVQGEAEDVARHQHSSWAEVEH